MLQARAKLPPSEVALTLAQCHEALGQMANASEQYRAALKAKPDDVLVVRHVAGHALRVGRFDEAEPLLRKIIEGPMKVSEADVDAARRDLALVLSAQGDYQKLQQALDLVGLKLERSGAASLNQKEGVEAPAEELLAQAHVLALQPYPKLRARAVTLLEQLNRRQMLSADDQYLLVQLYQGDGHARKAREVLRTLLASHGGVPKYLNTYAHVLIGQREFAEAERAITRLEELEKAQKVEPNAFRTVQLRALLLDGRGKGDEALALIRRHVSRPGARAEEDLLLARHLANQNQLAEALDVCERAWQKCPPEAVSAASVVLVRTSKAGPKECARVEGWIRKALEKNPTSVALRMHLADLQDLRENFDDVDVLYRQILARDGGNVVALNNQAWLLAQRADKAGEALPLITKALAVLGPRPELLDTRAVAYLAQGKHDRAIADLEQAIADAPTASRYFHLAQAYRAADKLEAAREALRKANELDLRPAQLHPLERPAWERLLAELGTK
jgi:tetratricopeptide (TPR) repeat protein